MFVYYVNRFYSLWLSPIKYAITSLFTAFLLRILSNLQYLSFLLMKSYILSGLSFLQAAILEQPPRVLPHFLVSKTFFVHVVYKLNRCCDHFFKSHFLLNIIYSCWVCVILGTACCQNYVCLAVALYSRIQKCTDELDRVNKRTLSGNGL